MPDNYTHAPEPTQNLIFNQMVEKKERYAEDENQRDRRYFFAEMLREGLRLGFTPEESISLAKTAVEAYKAV